MSVIDRKIEAVLELFSTTYSVFAEAKPLALGTREQLIERHPNIEPRLVRSALLKHCKRPRYLKALASGTQRYDLDGNPAGELTAEQREKAKRLYDEQKELSRAAKKRRKEQRRLEMEAAARRAEQERAKQAKESKPVKAPVSKTEVAAGLITLKQRPKRPEKDVTT